MPSIIACDHAFMSSKRMLVRPVIDFRHSAENGSAKSLTKSIRLAGSSAEMMRIGMGLELRGPVCLHGFRRDGRKDRLALRHVRIAVLAHHVMAHQSVHQAFGLMRTEHVDLLLGDEDIVAVREHRAAELRHGNAIGASLRSRASAG